MGEIDMTAVLSDGVVGGSGVGGVLAPAGGLWFEGVGKVFPNGVEACRDVTFGLEAGEFVSVVGPSGCGKSTLLRVASGLSAATSGRVVRPLESVGFVFQDPTLLPWRSVQDNVELFLELRGVAKRERGRIADEALGLVGLSDYTELLPRQLSGGMRMRASLARSLSLRPELFLFDEPFAALDEFTRLRLNEEVNRLFVDERFAGLFITHNIAEAVFLSSRVLVMSPRPGRIVAGFEVPFEHPRPAELRFDAEYTSLCRQVSEALRAGGGT